MPGICGGDNTSPEYAPHMWIGEHFIHNSEKTLKVEDWWYRAGRLLDESIVAERWKGQQYGEKLDREAILPEDLPAELLEAIQSVSRAAQEDFQRQMEAQMGPPR